MPEGGYRLAELFEQCEVFRRFSTMVIQLMENNSP